MTRKALTADLGNSALKLLVWQRVGREWIPGEAYRLSWAEDWEYELASLLARLDSLELCTSCSVTRSSRSERLGVRLSEPPCKYYPEPEPGLEIDCREPWTIGRDRLYAARGGWELVRGPALIVDAGTALTVDALDSVEGRPHFLGGAIAPGPELCARALSRGAANLFEIEPDPRAPALGRDSAEALRAGVSVGFAGAAGELVRRIGREAGLEDAPILLTGGATAFLQAPGVFAREPRVVPELVHRGLLAAADRLR